MKSKIFKMLLSYDGTNYSGWQVQPNGTSIQTILENALTTVLREPIQVTGSGRTDAGVHALGQVAHFKSEQVKDPARLTYSVNALLPHDIRIKSIEEAESGFHARYSALSKIYHYHLHLDRVLDPFKRLYSLHVLEKADVALLKKGAELLIGTHDFTSFANEAHRGSAAKNGIRTLKRLDVVEESGGVRLEFEADGFLYKMVRNLVGTLLDIATKKTPLDEIPSIFASKDRKNAGYAAPPHGLFLVSVDYGEKLAISKKEENLGTSGISSNSS